MSLKTMTAAAAAAIVLSVLAPTISSASIPGFPGHRINCGPLHCWGWDLDYHLKPQPGIPFNSPTRQLQQRLPQPQPPLPRLRMR